MKNSYPTEKESLTPQDILEILKDSHLQQCQYDPEADSEIDLTFESTIDEWRYACDLVSWKPLGKALNEWFGVSFSPTEWKNTLDPSEKRKLHDVCTLIAKQGRRYSIKPLKICGSISDEAGIFFTVRAALKQSGVETDKIKPSSSLQPVLRNHWGTFLDEIGKISPGTLPPVVIKETLFFPISIILISASLFIGLVNIYFANITTKNVAFLIGAFGIFSYFVNYLIGPKSVILGELTTFGDLCSAISNSRNKKMA